MAGLNIVNQNLVPLIVASLIIEGFLLASVVYCFFKIAAIRKKSAVFFKGKDGKNLEELITKNSADIKTVDEEIQELYDISNRIHSLALKSIHKVEIIRFNPFGDIGGDQSFSVALLDGKNTGIVISSLHTKEGTRVYSKPIIKGEADKYPLTNEEKQVIKIAVQQKPSKI
jgi:hypothetical protein